MNSITPPRSGETSLEPTPSLVERVRARVADADSALERRRRALRPGSKRVRDRQRDQAAGVAPDAHQSRETRSLGRVFHELGDAHRQYRLQSGQRVSPGLKQAAHAFKEAPSLTTLVAVAAYLDEDGLLAW